MSKISNGHKFDILHDACRKSVSIFGHIKSAPNKLLHSCGVPRSIYTMPNLMNQIK